MSGIVHGCKSRKMGSSGSGFSDKKERSVAELYELKEAEERVILIAVRTCEEDDTEACLEELEELVKTAGSRYRGQDDPEPGTYPSEPILARERSRRCGNASGSWGAPVWCAMMNCLRHS